MPKARQFFDDPEAQSALLNEIFERAQRTLKWPRDILVAHARGAENKPFSVRYAHTLKAIKRNHERSQALLGADLVRHLKDHQALHKLISAKRLGPACNPTENGGCSSAFEVVTAHGTFCKAYRSLIDTRNEFLRAKRGGAVSLALRLASALPDVDQDRLVHPIALGTFVALLRENAEMPWKWIGLLREHVRHSRPFVDQDRWREATNSAKRAYADWKKRDEDEDRTIEILAAAPDRHPPSQRRSTKTLRRR